MIFVSVGTNEWPFDRLVEAAGRLDSEDVVIQRGSSQVHPPNAVVHDFLPFEAMVLHIREASAVVTHAGVGSVIVALANGKRPVVVARLGRLREAVDDHQVWFAERLAADGLVDVATPETLAEALAKPRATHAVGLVHESALVEELRGYIDDTLKGAAGRRRPSLRRQLLGLRPNGEDRRSVQSVPDEASD